MTFEKMSNDDKVTQNADAGWTLVRWFGIPIILVAALYFVQRTLDERPLVVVTNRGPMLTTEEMAAAHPIQPPAPTGPATNAPTQLSPVAPAAPQPATLANTTPQALAQPSPSYPQRALDAEREGVVRLRLYITPDGHVAEAKVLRAEPEGWFERAAQDGVKRWRYAPSEFGGTAEVDVEFKLK
ncbi:MAG: TonB family protein [Alphaproteobacteria bacterium]|nr:TonB family protein [Alphaproteobacteria bacterium]